MLGLRAGERLLLTLESAGITRVAYAGTGPQPTSARARLQVVSNETLLSLEEPFLLLPADLVVDAAILDDPSKLSSAGPIRLMSPREEPLVVSSAEEWLERLGEDEAKSGQRFAIRLTGEDETRRAESALLASLTKPSDGVFSRHIHRRISLALSRRLSRYRVTPNHLTALVFAIGVLSGPIAAQGTYLAFCAGAFCYWLAAVLDGCDGELARLKFLQSPVGAWLDTITDDAVCLSYVTGMYLGLFRSAAHPFWFWIGLWAICFYVLTLVPRYYVMSVRSGSGDYQKMAAETRSSPKAWWSKLMLFAREVIFRTDFLPSLALITAILGLVPTFAVAFAAGAVASSIDSFVLLSTYRRTL